tara:strand:+ start:53042 stop:54076 length:1035 start_codon:yes stop_codon:yes gene_type:complete
MKTSDIDIRRLPVNKIINGGMELAQRNTSFSGLTGFVNQYTLDRYNFLNSSVNPFTFDVEQDSDIPTDLVGYNSMKVTSTTGGTIHTDGYVSIEQRVEGYNLIDIVNKDFIVAFRVKASNIGTNSVFLSNTVFDQRIAIPYEITVADEWQTVYVNVPGRDFSTGFDLATGLGLRVAFVIAAGAGTRQEEHNGVWQTGAGGNTGVIGQVNNFANNGDYIQFSGVMVYDATHGEIEFERAGRNYVEELALCQRYFEVVAAASFMLVPDGTNTTIYACSCSFKQTKRAQPVASNFDIGQINGGQATFSNTGATTSVDGISAVSTGTNASNINYTYRNVSTVEVDAEL